MRLLDITKGPEENGHEEGTVLVRGRRVWATRYLGKHISRVVVRPYDQARKLGRCSPKVAATFRPKEAP